MAGAHRIAPVAAITAVVAVVTFGLVNGFFVAAASDAYGYVSQADLWARGSPIVRQPFARDMTWPNAAETLAPLGYRPHRPAPHGTDIAPIYAPGVPMVMAVFQLLAGPRAVYLVVPLLGGLAVWATYLMGSRLAGPMVGALAATLLAASPSFLFEVVSPTSDVAATAWWALALGLALMEGRVAALGAGLSAGLAILTRPNLVPLVTIPGAVLAWRAVRSWFQTGSGLPHVAPRGIAGANPTARLLLFAAGFIPACIVMALLNRSLYGSPLASGYGSLSDLYDWSYLWPNLAHYPRWLVETQSLIVLLAFAAPFLLERTPPSPGAPSARAIAIAWWCFITVVLVSYIFYLPFEDWWYVRFMLPAYPPLLVLTSVALVRILAPLTRVLRGAGDIAAVSIVALVAWRGVAFSMDRGAHDQWKAEQRYLTVGHYIASALPERAALISMQHSGAIRYYSGRITVRYDLMQPTDLDLVVGELQRLGYAPYIVLDNWEEPGFRERFHGHSALAELDWMPVALLHSNVVKIYDPAERRPGRPDLQRMPDVVP